MSTYNRQYQVSFLPAPTGDKVKDGIKKHDDEFNSLITFINAMSSGNVPYRQTVLTGAVDVSGNPAYLTASGLSISVIGSSNPLIVSFANGYDASGYPIDYVVRINSDIVNAVTLPASNTCYVFIDRNASDGTITYGYSIISPIYTDINPVNPVNGQHWFPPFQQKMFVWNGSNWDVKQRVFLGVAVVGSSSMSLTLSSIVNNINNYNYWNLPFTEKFLLSNPSNGYVSPSLPITRNAIGQYFKFYPQGTVASATNIYAFTGSGNITLNGALTNVATTMSLSSAITFTGTPYSLIDINGVPEIVQMTAGSGSNTITIVRGQLGTTAVSHNSGGIVLNNNVGNVNISTIAPVSLTTNSLTPNSRDLFAYSVSGSGFSSCNITCVQEWGNR